MRYQGYANVGTVDEPESSSIVTIERDPALNPAIYCDCSHLPSLTRQEFAAEADINNLMAQYEKTGILPTVNRADPAFLDVSDVPDLQSAMALVAAAQEAFMSLPASTRLTFDNDPVKFVAFAENPDNIEQMREWKLAPPKEEPPAPQKVEIVNPPPAEKT